MRAGAWACVGHGPRPPGRRDERVTKCPWLALSFLLLAQSWASSFQVGGPGRSQGPSLSPRPPAGMALLPEPPGPPTAPGVPSGAPQSPISFMALEGMCLPREGLGRSGWWGSWQCSCGRTERPVLPGGPGSPRHGAAVASLPLPRAPCPPGQAPAPLSPVLPRRRGSQISPGLRPLLRAPLFGASLDCGASFRWTRTLSSRSIPSGGWGLAGSCLCVPCRGSWEGGAGLPSSPGPRSRAACWTVVAVFRL